MGLIHKILLSIWEVDFSHVLRVMLIARSGIKEFFPRVY